MMWDYMGLIRVYTKRRGAPPLFNDPLVLSSERKGISVEVRSTLGWCRLMMGSRPPRWPEPPTTAQATNPLTTPMTPPHVTPQVATESISKELHEIFNYALVWGRSTKYDPQRCGFQHEVSGLVACWTGGWWYGWWMGRRRRTAC